MRPAIVCAAVHTEYSAVEASPQLYTYQLKFVMGINDCLGLSCNQEGIYKGHMYGVQTDDTSSICLCSCHGLINMS